MSGNRWRIIVLLMGYAAIGHFNRVGISVAGDEMFIPKLGIPETRMGWVYTAFLTVYTIGMLPAGWLIDRIGAARVLTLFGLTMGTFVVNRTDIGRLPSRNCKRLYRAERRRSPIPVLTRFTLTSSKWRSKYGTWTQRSRRFVTPTSPSRKTAVERLSASVLRKGLFSPLARN